MASTATAQAIPTGRIFNPHSHFCGSFIPNWLLRRHEISHGAKLVYGRLCQYAGKDGECYPKLQTLADELAMGLSTVHKYVHELERWNLIRSIRRGLGMPNKYLFLTHIWMGGSFRDGSTIADPAEISDHEPDPEPVVEPVVEPGPHEAENLISTKAKTLHLEENQEKNNCRLSHESLFKRIKSKFTRKNPVVKGVMDKIPAEHRASCERIAMRYAKSRGIGYLERAVAYVMFRNPENFGAYLACTLREGWGEDWHQQRQEAARMDAERIEQAQRKAAEVEAENKRIEAVNQEFEARREKVFGMSPDDLAELERDFVGGLSGLRLKRYRKRGLSAVEWEFVLYVEKVLTYSKEQC